MLSSPAPPIGIQAPGGRCWKVALAIWVLTVTRLTCLEGPCRSGAALSGPAFEAQGGGVCLSQAKAQPQSSLPPEALTSTSSGWAEVREIGTEGRKEEQARKGAS